MVIAAPGAVAFGVVAAQVARAAGLDDSIQRSWWSADRLIAPTSMLGSSGLRTGDVLSLNGSQAERRTRSVLALHQVGGRGAGRVVALERGRLRIGRARDCDIVLADLDVSRRHVQIDVSPTSIHLSDLGSTNGTFVDEQRVPAAGTALTPGSSIRLGDSTFAIAAPTDTPAAVSCRADGGLSVARAPHLSPPAEVEEIVVPVRPNATRPRGVQWVTALIPAVAGGAVAWLTDSPQFMLFALLSPVMMITSGFGERLHWRRSRRRDAAAHARAFAVATAQIADAIDAEVRARHAAAPDPAAVLRFASLPGSRLWERRRDDAQFLDVRLGTADVASRLRRRTGAAAEPAAVLVGAPVAASLRDGPLGAAGPRDVINAASRWWVGQIAALHSPNDVRFSLLLASTTAGGWSWARWLPHLGCRVAIEAEERVNLVNDLVNVVESRSRMRRADRHGWPGDWHIVVIDRGAVSGELPGLGVVLERGAAVGITAICVAEEQSGLPAACHSVLGVSGETGSRAAFSSVSRTPLRDVVLDAVPEHWADAVARSLAPLVAASGDTGAGIPSSVRLVDVLDLEHGNDIDPASIARRWAASDGNLDTIIGVGTDGATHLDLVSDGPHALVAGTTGSGKSELLQTLVVGIAAQHPPDLVNFLLVDYKGGAAFGGCARLPHTAGLVTDLDAHLTARALRSLRSELRRRERLFAQYGVADLPGYRGRTGTAPLARLVIVVDEFASLADELPDFVRGLVGVAQRGRSLGVHLVLATQRPGGAVSAEIRANTTTRICLRVTDPGESSDVIDAPEAASVDRSTPGRGYVRAGGSLASFQAARTSGREVPATAVTVQRLTAWRRPPDAADDAQDTTDLVRLVRAISGAGQLTGRAPASTPWTDPLPEGIVRSALDQPAADTCIPYAAIDLPDEQRRDTLSLDLARGSSLLAVGGPRSGRTTLLTALALGSAAALAPERLYLYVVDPSGALAALAGRLPHCATVVGPEGLAITGMLLRRLGHAASRRVRSQASDQHRMAMSLLLIDNWDSIVSGQSDADALDCGEALAALQRLGPAARVTTVVTGDRSALAPRFAASFSHKLLFRLADRNDFGLVGISPRDVPSRMPAGRALRVGDAAAVQVAHLTDEPTVAALMQLADTAARTWPVAGVEPNDQRQPDAVRLRALPDRVALDTLPREHGRITLGVGGEAATPVSLDLFAGAGRLLVAGPPRSGRTTLLRSLLAQATDSGADVVVAASARSPLRVAATELGTRIVDPLDDLSTVGSTPRTPTLLLVDDCDRFQDGPAGEALTGWLRNTDAPLAAVVAGRSDELATSYRGLGAQARRHNCGVLLRPGPIDGELLGVRLPRRPSSGPPGSGVLIGDPAWGPMFDGSAAVPLQVALP